MEWSCEDIFKVINLYQQFPCLWDIKSSVYKRTDLKRNAWQEIGKNMCKDEEEVRKKIKNLRSAYVAERRKIESSKKSGSSSEDLFVPHLFYLEKLNFLNTAVMFRQTTSNLINQKELQTPTLSFGTEHFTSLGANLDDSFLEFKENLLESQESLVSSKSVDSPVTSDFKSSLTTDFNKTSEKRRFERDEKFSSAIDAFVRQADMSCAMMSCSKKDEESVYTSFGKSISLQLAQLPLSSAAEAMAEIQTILTKRILKGTKTDILQTAINEANIE